MRDVARAAGVSPSLVSIVFRGVPGAGEATRARVLAVARELGYVRDERARDLRSSRPGTIGVTFHLGQPLQGDVVSALYDHVPLAEHSIILSPISESRSEERAIDDLVGNRCGALVLLSSQLPTSRLLTMAARGPIVSVARRVEGAGVDWVAADGRGGVVRALEHLHGLGHRDVVYLSDEESAGGPDRVAGFNEAARALGIADTVAVVPSGSTENAGVAAMESVLASGRVPSAVMGFNDRCALGAMDFLLRNGVRVPEEVSVVGFDDSEIASRRLVEMTTVRQSPEDLAREAARLALRRLEAPRGAQSTRGEGVLLDTTVVERSTTGPAPGTPFRRP